MHGVSPRVYRETSRVRRHSIDSTSGVGGMAGYSPTTQHLSFDQLSVRRFSTAHHIQLNGKPPVKSTQEINLFFENAIKKTQDRRDKNQGRNQREQQELDRLNRRDQNLKCIRNLIEKGEGEFLGAMGWGDFCDFKTTVGDGSSEVDSIYLNVQGEIKCLQLDSCLEAQQLQWRVTDSSSIGEDESQQHLSIHGRLFSSTCHWEVGSRPSVLYRKNTVSFQPLAVSSCLPLANTVIPSATTACTRHSCKTCVKVPTYGNVPSGLASFKAYYCKVKPTVHEKNRPIFYKVQEKLFPEEPKYKNHRLDVERAFQTPQRVVANGMSWHMPGDGSAVVIGKDYTQNGWHTIDHWVDVTTTKKCNPPMQKGPDEAVYLQNNVMPMDQVTNSDTARIMLNAVLINAASGYSLAKYDDEIFIEPEMAQKLFDSLQKDYGNGEVSKNAYGYRWVYDAAQGTEYEADYTKLAKKLMKQLHAWTTFADHAGVCCPSCNEGKCDIKKERKISVIGYKNVTEATPTLESPSIAFYDTGDVDLHSVCNALTNALGSIAAKVEGFDLNGLVEYMTILDQYQANSKFKIAMLMQQTMTILDTIDTYAKSEQDQKLEGLLTPEINNLKTILFELTRGLVTNPDIPDSVTNDNWDTPEIVKTNYKARFAIAATVTSALDVLGSLGDKLLPIAKQNVFSKAKLNPNIDDEATYLKKYRRLNADPKVEPIDVTRPLGDRLTHLLRPIPLNMVAGKLGVGKSQFLTVSFDDTSFTTINGRKVFKLDNIEKAASNFDVKGSRPEEILLVTITKDGLEELKQTFSLDVASAKKAEDSKDGTKLVGCSCCSGRGLTQAALEGVSRGVKGVDSEVILLDSIGYADFKGIATISHESVMGRVFFNHALTLVNLCNPDWETIYAFINTKRQERLQPGPEMIDALDGEFGGEFTNVLVQQLVHATHVLVNNHGQNGPVISSQDLQMIIASIGGRSHVIEGFKATRKSDESVLLSHFDYSLEGKLSPLTVPQEVDLFDSELDARFTQEVLDISKLSEAQKEVFKLKLREMGNSGKIDRAKAHLNVGGQWEELQITDGSNFYYRHIQQSKRVIDKTK